jgi:hypothetical protein
MDYCLQRPPRSSRAFYDSLSALETDELVIVVGPGFFNPLLTVAADDPHEEYCADQCEASLVKLDTNYATMVNSPNAVVQSLASAYYWSVMQSIINTLSDCMGYGV